jgi:hypothetical protein
MKIKKILVAATLLITFASNAQIDKGNWMMGGSGRFGNYKTTNSDESFNTTQIGINPNIGYFIIDKLAVGTSAQFSFTFFSNDSSIYKAYIISPFLRYYFFESDKKINIFSEVNYEFLRISNNVQKQDNFKVKAGVVFFLNSSVGIEVALNYSKQKSNLDYENRGIYLDVGFQIHLERE